jgi:hypothetical protein
MAIGWNWISFPVEFDSLAVNDVFAPSKMGSGAFAALDQIKDQFMFTEYYAGYGFYGTLATVTTDSMYAIKLAANGDTFTMTGPPVTLPKTINLNIAWTYISMPYQTNQPLSNTFLVADGVSVTFQATNQIKDFYTFAEYYEGYGWYGTLTTMVPGTGYMIKTTTAGTATYPALGGRRQLAEPKKLIAAPSVEEVTSAGPSPADWKFAAGRYAQTMSVTALVTVGGARKESGTLAAMVGSELRGVQSTAKVPPFGAYAGKAMYLIVVRANEDGETVSFQYFDGATKTALDKTIKFSANGKEGNVIAPLMMAQKPKLFG